MIIEWLAAATQLAAGQVPPPTVEDLMANVEATIRRQLVDPDSAKFEWPFEFKQTEPFRYYTCGRYNAKNRMGGYAGASWFSVAVVDRRVASIQLEEDSPWIGGQCAKAARKGELQTRS